MEQVPSSIYFDSELLFIPKFTEVGIPLYLGGFGQLESQVTVGQWVNRGDLLLKTKYIIYSSDQKPRFPFVKDKTFDFNVSLLSPVSGLVLQLRKEHVCFWWNYGFWYEEKEVLPVILIPRDEPPQNNSELSFFREIGNKLRHNWQRVQNEYQRKCVRLGEVMHKLEPKDKYETAVKTISAFHHPRLSQFETRQMTSQDYKLLRNIQKFRADDLVLRDKLAHLTKLGDEID